MKQAEIHDFMLRVTQASRSELIVIMYDIILADYASARTALAEGDRSLFRKELKHAERFLNELMGALDYRYSLSFDLMSLYIYANRETVRAYTTYQTEPLVSAEQVLVGLRKGFEAVAAQDTSGPVMRNTQKLTAGLTYGKNCLDEICVNANEATRGFYA